jgi:hypothetical protein
MLSGARQAVPDFAMGLLSGNMAHVPVRREKGLDTVCFDIYDLKNFKVYRQRGIPRGRAFRRTGGSSSCEVRGRPAFRPPDDG